MAKNIFAKKLAEDDQPDLPIDPIKLYQTCNYKDGYAYLRGIQEEVLKEWHQKRKQRDVLVKMNTGSGKTLTSLLMLYSKMIEKKLPVLYVCPDNQLVEQVASMGMLYGIPVCKFDRQSEFPSDFINSKKILVCNFFKLFNGRSIFVRDNIKLGAIVIDDAHRAADIARKQSGIVIDRDHTIAKKLWKLFEQSLKHQLVGTFHRLKEGDPHMLMKVPYWSWLDNVDKITSIITEYIAKEMEEGENLHMPWNLMADELASYDCYIGGKKLEIVPIHVPCHLIPSFHEADHRYILSATFEDDFDLIRDMGIDKDSILKPIIPTDRKDVGKRLILAPKRFDPDIEDDEMIEFISKYPKKKYNVVVLVPSGARAKIWEDAGATIVDTNNIEEAIHDLSKSKGNFFVFMNRYDGIDLHGDLCRILVIDGMPLYKSLEEHYAETRLDTVANARIAMNIEQGLGRGVRSGADFCVVYLMGKDLLKFLAYTKNMDYFTPITRSQLNLGLKLLDGETPDKNSLKTIKEIADLCLTENEDWLKFHSRAMLSVSDDEISEEKKKKIDLANSERIALSHFRKRDYDSATSEIRKLINTASLTAKEKGWYFQLAGQMLLNGDRRGANELQGQAWIHTTHMFHPETTHAYKKALKKDGQAPHVKSAIAQFEKPMDVKLYVTDLVNSLQYGSSFEAKDFEKKLNDLGEFLGFDSQQPDETTGDGPDVLWLMSDGYFLIFEAKSEKESGEISKADIEQLQQAELWFAERYGKGAKFDSITMQSVNKKEKRAHVKDQKIIDKDNLELLCKNVIGFTDAVTAQHISGFTIEEIAKLLVAYKLTPALIRDTYIKPIK